MEEEIKNTELFMLAQFIDILDIICKYNNIEEVRNDITERKKLYLKIIQSKGEKKDIFSLNLDENSIDKKLQKAKEIYPKNKQINEVHFAYKIGLIDGMKVKSK